MTEPKIPPGRVIGLDCHPDTFTAAILVGTTPANAIREKLFNYQPLGSLLDWAKQHTKPDDLFVLEASGNSFHIVRELAKVPRQARVLESRHLGKLKEAHANNDKISAERIAKAYLAGTAREVWVPDAKTQERRDVFLAYTKAVKSCTQVTNRLLGYLSNHGVRLPKGASLATGPAAAAQLRPLKAWTPCQWLVIEGLQLELGHAEAQRAHWRSLIAQEVIRDPVLLSLVRLCGVRDVVAFAIGAVIGDIQRFAKPGKLVSYTGLDPAFDHSGEGQWSGGLSGHGRKDLRSLLIEAAQAILRAKHPLAKWGAKLLRRKGAYNLVVAAVARKLLVAIWYLLMGRWTQVEEIDDRLALKVGKIITSAGPKALATLGKTRKACREDMYTALKTGREYVLRPVQKFKAAAAATTATPAAAT
jgi:transposase